MLLLKGSNCHHLIQVDFKALRDNWTDLWYLVWNKFLQMSRGGYSAKFVKIEKKLCGKQCLKFYLNDVLPIVEGCSSAEPLKLT